MWASIITTTTPVIIVEKCSTLGSGHAIVLRSLKKNALTPEGLLARWQAIVADHSPRAWEAENAYGFFLPFAGRPEQLRAALKGVPRAEAVATRLERAFAAARHPNDDAYLIVRRPLALAKKAATELALAHAQSMARKASDLGHADVEDYLAELETVEVIRDGERPPPTEEDSMLYDLEPDWFRDACASPFANAMREAAYSLAADYPLAHFVLWPLAGRRSDPYSHYFELWSHGATVRYAADRLIVYVTPRGRGA